MTARRAALAVFALGVIAFTVGSHLWLAVYEPDPGAAPSAAPQSIGTLYQLHFRAARHERMFLASIAFFATFAITRAITHSIRAGLGLAFCKLAVEAHRGRIAVESELGHGAKFTMTLPCL